MMIPVEGTPYAVRDNGPGRLVMRPAIDGTAFPVAGPFHTREDAEAAARRLASAKSAEELRMTVRVIITVEESSSDDPRIRPTVASRQITYYENQPYTIKLETPDGCDLVTRSYRGKDIIMTELLVFAVIDLVLLAYAIGKATA